MKIFSRRNQTKLTLAAAVNNVTSRFQRILKRSGVKTYPRGFDFTPLTLVSADLQSGSPQGAERWYGVLSRHEGTPDTVHDVTVGYPGL